MSILSGRPSTCFTLSSLNPVCAITVVTGVTTAKLAGALSVKSSIMSPVAVSTVPLE